MSPDAAALHERLFTIDTHIDTPTASLMQPGWDFAAAHEFTAGGSQCDLPRMKQGGIDALVFTGGIGENDVATRAEVLNAAAWAGFVLDADANAVGGPRISRGRGPSAWVIPTNEELTIARQTRAARSIPTSQPSPA